MNGIPINADNEIIIDEDVMGMWFIFCPYIRKSWLWLFCIIMYPTVVNNSALNSACMDIWKKANIGMFMDKVLVISPSWRRVNSAIIIFMSF